MIDNVMFADGQADGRRADDCRNWCDIWACVTSQLLVISLVYFMRRHSRHLLTLIRAFISSWMDHCNTLLCYWM